MTDQTTTDFDGCRRTCRKAGAHTLIWGDCQYAPQPEPTVSLSKVFTDTDGQKSIGFDNYTAQQLADLIEPALRHVAVRFGPNALAMLQRGETVGLSGGEYADLAREAAHAIVHRNDSDVAQSAPLPVSEARTRLLQALDAPYCQALGYTPEGLLAAYEASRTQAVDQAALRDRVAKALADEDARSCGWGHDFLDRYGVDAETDGFVDALLAAVLPATTNHDTDTDVELRAEVDQWRATFGRDALPGALRRLERAEAERDSLGREADRLRKGWVEMRDRAERAEADRAAVLREAADRIDNEELPPDYVDMFDNGARWAAKLLRRVADETAATETPWPTQQRWRIELFDYLAEEWSPGGTRWPTREQAMERIQLMREKAPMWKDGTPTQRRVIRETTTYTVESEPAAGARQDGADRG